MAVDGQNPDFIRDVLLEKIDAMEKDMNKGAFIFPSWYIRTNACVLEQFGLIAALGSR